MTNTARFGIAKPADADLVQAGAGVMRAAFDGFDAVITGYSAGPFVSRPAANVSEGRIYRATDVLDASPNGTSYFSDGTAWYSLVQNANKGFTNIAATETRTNTAYGTLTTPDQVTITLPANGLISVYYQATWQSSNSSLGAALVMLNGVAVRIEHAGANSTSGVWVSTSMAATDELLTSSAIGLISGGAGSAYGGDVTTGQLVGLAGTGPVGVPGGGPMSIFAAAGTYTVSVQFSSSAGSVTAKNRKLWVKAEAFA